MEETPIRERQNKTPMKLKHTEHLCQNVIKAKRLVLDSCGTDIKIATCILPEIKTILINLILLLR